MPSFYPSLAPLPTDIGSASNPIIITWVPTSDLSKMQSANTAITNVLEQKTGFKFKSSIAKTQIEAVDAIGNGNAQIAWLDAFSYVAAKKRYNITLGLVGLRNGKDSTTSEIIVSTSIASIAELKGKTFCVADRQSLTDFVVPSIILNANGIDPQKDLRITETRSAIETVRAIYNRTCDAGAVSASVRDDARQEMADLMTRIQVLDTSPIIPNHAVVISNNLAADKRNVIVRVLEDLPSATLATHPYLIDSLAPRDDKLYDRLRDLFTKAGVNVWQRLGK
jgi:phosphonate transport system substrate-binding protein